MADNDQSSGSDNQGQSSSGTQSTPTPVQSDKPVKPEISATSSYFNKGNKNDFQTRNSGESNPKEGKE